MNEQNNQELYNQQSMIANSPEPESLSDLPLTGEHTEEIKAGPSGLSAGKVSYSDLSVMI